MEETSQPTPSYMVPVVSAVLITALVVGGGAFAYAWSRKTASEKDLNAQITSLQTQANAQAAATPTPAPTTQPSPSASPTAASKYSTLKSERGFSLEYLTGSSFAKAVSAGGVLQTVYTILTPDTTEAGVSNQGTTTISNLSYEANDADGTLTAVLASRNAHTVKDVKVGVGSKYAAKRYDDGGGMSGFTVSYLIEGTLKDGSKRFVTISYITENAGTTPAEIQHMLDTFAITK